MIVCDVCGKNPAETVGISTGGKNYSKDLCAQHRAELLKGARAPRRGRPARAAAARAPRRRRSAKTATIQTASASPTTAKRARRKITDPAILKNRRASLAKARQARAVKRAAASAALGS
jgi:hypothetical protein